MSEDDRLALAVKEYMRTIKALSNSSKPTDEIPRERIPEWVDLQAAAKAAAIEYELALLEKGFLPPLPPKTQEGYSRWGLTPEQVAQIFD
jgi:hypothetical protein